MSKLHFGWKVESQAEAWYRNRTPGARLIDRNFRCRSGEIDLIFEEPLQVQAGRDRQAPTELVFIEVRARIAGASWETGVESVGLRKQLRLVRSIQVFLARYRGQATGARLDILAWDGSSWEHLRNQWPLSGGSAR